jgi:uncharacterized protein (DUF1800 family)
MALLSRLDVWQEEPQDQIDLSQDEAVRQLNEVALLRATYGKWQLKERMASFWADHFNVYARKEQGMYQLGQYEHKVIRDHALGNFADLVTGMSQSPAMLSYLDNRLNVNGVANENFARELMELHTLGVHGGYTQKDVQEVARCFTGWTLQKGFLRRRDTFVFDQSKHDTGEKIVLGHRIKAGGGEDDAKQVLAILTSHPSCANFVAGKLCRHFLGSSDHPLKSQLAQLYSDNHGDIKSMIRPLFLSPALLTGPPVAKRPFHFVVSALRAVGADSDCGGNVVEHLTRMGQSMYEWPMPDGYPDRPAAWTGSLLQRWNFALDLGHGRIGGTSVDLAELEKRGGNLEAIVLCRRGAKLAAPAGAKREDIAALCLASPEFQLG